jgi:hypothetical protein
MFSENLFKKEEKYELHSVGGCSAMVYGNNGIFKVDFSRYFLGWIFKFLGRCVGW